MIKKYDEFISEALTPNTSNVETWASIIDDILPGGDIDVTFPENFELEYYIYRDGEHILRRFVCTELHVYYWDEYDHNNIDYYFYEPKETHQSRSHEWTCKMGDLTKDSKKKVLDYLAKTPVN